MKTVLGQLKIYSKNENTLSCLDKMQGLNGCW